MATDPKQNDTSDFGAKPPDRVPESVAVPPVSPPEAPSNDVSGGNSDAKARFEQSQPAYKQRQERFRAFGTEGSTGRYRTLPTKDPALRSFDRFLLQRISAGLLGERIVLLECIEQRLLQDARLWLKQCAKLSNFAQIAPNRESESIDQYLDVSGPAMLVLTATKTLLDSLSNKGNLFNFERITETLQTRDIVVLVCSGSELLADGHLREDRHLGQFRIQANALEHWLLPLLQERYGDRAKHIIEELAQQRKAGQWPADERDFHDDVTRALDEHRLDAEVHRRSSSQQTQQRKAEDVLEDGSRGLETHALFLRAFLRTSSTYVLEKSLEALIGPESDEWKRYQTDRRAILDLVQASGAAHVKKLFEGDKWLLVKLTEGVLDRLLPASQQPELNKIALR